MTSIDLITKKKKNRSGISYMSVRFCDKATDFENELVVQCDVSTVKNTSLVGSGSDN